MRPRPFYRWKSFWLGLFVLSFLSWACWDSSHYLSSATWVWRATIWSGEGRVGAVVNPQAVFRLGWNGFELSRDPLSVDGLDEELVRDSLTYETLAGGLVCLWLAWLVWHWKREQRKLTA